MATATQAPTQLPDITVPIAYTADKQPVYANPDWYRYMKRIDELIRALRLEIP